MTEGRPGRRETHKASTRRALEEAALRRFAAEGYEETSVDAIAADAGVSSRTFFRYFATKDEVLDMGREERQAELRSRIRGLAATDLTSLQVVRAGVVELARGFETDRERVHLRQRAAATSPVLRGRLYDTFQSWEHVVARELGGDSAARTLAAVGLAVFRASRRLARRGRVAAGDRRAGVRRDQLSGVDRHSSTMRTSRGWPPSGTRVAGPTGVSAGMVTLHETCPSSSWSLSASEIPSTDSSF